MEVEVGTKQISVRVVGHFYVSFFYPTRKGHGGGTIVMLGQPKKYIVVSHNFQLVSFYVSFFYPTRKEHGFFYPTSLEQGKSMAIYQGSKNVETPLLLWMEGVR